MKAAVAGLRVSERNVVSRESWVRLGALAIAIAIDLALGEPSSRLHPVVWIGRLISRLEARAPVSGAASRLIYGLMMAVATPVLTILPATLVLKLTRRCHPLIQIAVQALMLKSTFAVRDLFAHLERVRRPLDQDRLDDARSSLQMIVSRDTAGLASKLVAAAAIESAAENASDSFVAPVFFHVVAGPVGALAYRACNTLDAMIGYHGHYEHLGKAAARVDDLLNVVPARITAVLIALASPLVEGNVGRAWDVALRYHGQTESPNAGWPMSAMAGAIEIELEKVGQYRLGDPIFEADASAIRRAEWIVGGTMALATGLAGLALAARAIRGSAA